MDRFTLRSLVNYSDDNILTEIRRVADIVKKPKLTKKDFAVHSCVNISTVTKRFGGWRNALDTAGRLSRYSGKSVTDKQRKQESRLWSNERLLKELKAIAHGKGADVIGVEDIREYSNYISPHILRSRFGTVENAIIKAGLKISNKAKRYTDDDCFENLLTVWTHYGRPPKYQEMYKPPSTVGSKAYIARWGTWRKALHAFVEKMNANTHENMPTSVSNLNNKDRYNSATLNQQSKLPLSEADSREIKLSLRYRVLKRDSFKCVLCGRSPATTIGLELHVDHIIPFSREGKTVESNLRTLCSECNIGKGVTIE